MELEGKPSRVTCWAKSTQSKVENFLDDYLINYPVKSVRQSTRNLLISLFKKGTPLQKQKMLSLIGGRIAKISSMGNSSSEFLTLIQSIFKGQVSDKDLQKKQMINLILQKGYQILKHVISSDNYAFYSYLSNTIQFSAPLQPYLIQASGCLKCYGKVQFSFQQKEIKQVLRQTKAHISQVQLIFNRTYAVKNLKINLGKRKFIYISVSIFYVDQKGEKKQLGGKYNPQSNIPALQFSGEALIFQFQLQKSKKHIVCHLCQNANSPDQYCFICSVCFHKFIDIDGSFKVIGADPQRLSLQLCDKYEDLQAKKDQLKWMYQDIKNNKKAMFPNYMLIKQMQTIYGQIMKNLQLFKREESKQSSRLRECEDCFSCNIHEIQNITQFLKSSFDLSEQMGQSLMKSFTSEQFNGLLQILMQLCSMNKVNKLQRKINQIIANLILYKSPSNINYTQQLQKLSSPGLSAQILYQLIATVKQKQNKLKQGQKLGFNWSQLAEFLNSTAYIGSWSQQQKVMVFSAYFIKSEMNGILNMDSMEETNVEKQTLADLVRLDMREYKQLQNLIDFPISSLLKHPISTSIKLFLSLLPQSLVPAYSIEISEPLYLKYIKTTLPQITDKLIFSSIVFSPNPIIKLNMFSTLPNLVDYLSIQDAIKLVCNLGKYKQLWNLNLKQTLQRFQEKLNKEETDKKLIYSLLGYDISKQSLYLNKIYQVLVPQRMNFIIRLQLPQADMLKQQRSRQGGMIQYVYLPVRQVKSQDLKGDTMRSLHQWVIGQLIKANQNLPFDLIVDKYIIDKLELPIQVVYRKIVQKQVKKKLGSQEYDFFRVIYRMQGFLGQPNQSASPNPRDEKLETCLNYSSYLLTKIPAIKKTGLDVIMQILSQVRKPGTKQQHRMKILKILQIISMNPSVIKKIIEWQYADLIINLTIQFFSLQVQQIKFSQVMLQICSKIIRQANQQMINLRKKSFNDGLSTIKQNDAMDLQGSAGQAQSQSQKIVKYLLQKVKQCQERGRRDLAQKMISLVSFCSKDQYGASKYLFQFFQLKGASISSLKCSTKTCWLLQFVESLSESYTSFKILCRQNKFTDQVIANILLYIQPFKVLQQNKEIKNLDSLQLSLSIIKGLIRGDEVLQKMMFDQNITKELYKISKLTENQIVMKNIKVGKVSTLSFQIVKYFKQGHIVHPQVSGLIKGQQANRIKKNQQIRASKLLALRQKTNLAAQKYQMQLMNNQQDNFVCSSCRQGYLKKSQVLGVYIYSSKQETLSVEGWWKQNKRQAGLTSVSYFTPIHYQCHMKAFQADQKNKTQWEGALIRNSVVKCNGWIGIKGPKTTDDEYDRVNRKYFDKNSKVSGYWFVLNDLNGLFEKFATEYNFSQETKGSSSGHNCKLIPVLMASTCHYMKKAGEDLKHLDQGVKYIEQHMTKRGYLLNLFFCVTLFTNTYSMFQQKKQKYFKLIQHLELVQFKEKKKFFIYLAIVNEIYSLIHVNLKDEMKIFQFIDKYIPSNFGTLISAFEKIAAKFKNLFIKWENEEQIKQYFSITS